MKPFLLNNFERILWISVLALVILFFKKCRGNDTRIAELKAENAALKKEKKDADNVITFQRQKYSTDSADARGKEQLAEREKLEADSKVKQQQTTIDRLAATIRRSNNQPVDTSDAVLVSRTYKNACDSFPPENDKLRAQLAEKDSSINQWSEILAYEIQLRDSALEAEQKHSARLNELYTRQSKITEDALKAAKPKGRFLLGIGLIGNQEKFIGGASAKAGYLTKKDKMYIYSPHLLQLPGMPKAGLFHEVSVMFNPFK